MLSQRFRIGWVREAGSLDCTGQETPVEIGPISPAGIRPLHDVLAEG